VLVFMATAAIDSVLDRIQRLRRSAATVAAIAGFLCLLWAAGEAQMLRAPASGVVMALLVAGLGVLLLPLTIAADVGAKGEHTRLRLAFATWGQVAIVTTAVLADTTLRLLLLATTLLALTFAALHLRKHHLVWVALAAWVTYASGSAWLLAEGVIGSSGGVWMNALGYGLAVAGGLLVSREVAHLREELSGRTQELEAALAKVRELAMRDDLTGLYNRRQLLDYLQRQKALADRDALTFAVCYVDLDHFKRVNDRFGHQQGDDVLKAFADVARRVVREEDFVARMGGEEFVMVLINATVTDAVRVADRLRRQTQLMLIHPEAPDFAVTASVGIAAYRKREPIEQLLNRADAAMYAAKSQGRNRVVVAPGIETETMLGTAAR
jgi:diguanylate cyclase (GGDEF)-like protein